MKQTKVASTVRQQKKLLEMKLQTSEGKSLLPKIFNAWTYY